MKTRRSSLLHVEVHILTEHGSEGFAKNGNLLRPGPGIPVCVHRFTYWMPAGPHRVEIVFSTGTSGSSMNLKCDGKALRGKAQTHRDFQGKGQTAKIIAPNSRRCVA